MKVLGRIERRYRLPQGYFKAKLPHASRASTGHQELSCIAPAERRRLAWHLPDDFGDRPVEERAEILEWVRTVVISGTTDYRRFQAEALKHRYAVRFPELTGRRRKHTVHLIDEEEDDLLEDVELELRATAMDAPRALASEVAHLIRFKTATLTDIGFQRHGVWNEQTALQKVEHLGLLFGALAAAPRGPVAGKGVPPAKLAMGILIFPAVWDWYPQADRVL